VEWGQTTSAGQVAYSVFAASVSFHEGRTERFFGETIFFNPQVNIMKKLFLFLLALSFLTTGCYRDDIDDLNGKYDELKKEQERQAELLAACQTLLQALENRLTINEVVEQEGGYKIVFSDQSELVIKDKSIVRIVDEGGSVVFHMSDGTTVTMGKTATLGFYALAEGTMGQPNGQLVYFDYMTATDKFVRNDSKRFAEYGDTPNDLMIYGSKMYCAITGSAKDGGVLRVIDTATGETIRDITLSRGSTKQQPRRLTATGGKVYATLYSGAVAQIDTVSYAASVIALGGTYSDGICVYDESLYICNSGQGAGNTISVVDIASFAETSTITVPYNPVNIVNAGNGELWFSTLTVWGGPAKGTPANVHVLDPAKKQVTHTFDVALENIVAGRNFVYGCATDWDTYGSVLKKISIHDKSVGDFTDGAEDYLLGYKLSLNPATGDLFMTQQMGDDIVRFKEDGTYVETLRTGRENGAAAVFVNVVR
jgi:hypothetical protein